MKKSKLIATFSAVAALCCVFVMALAGCSSGARKGVVDKARSIVAPSSGVIRVLQLTDLHMTVGNAKKQDKQTLRWVEEAVKVSSPDIVAVTGDAVGSIAAFAGRDKALVQLAEIFEKTETYWMYTFGNHDGEWSYETGTQVGKETGEASLKGRQELFDLLKGYKYSLMRAPDADEPKADGIGNYVVDVKDKDGNVIYAFVNMDTHGKKYVDGKDVGYLGLTANQVEWYEYEMEALKTRSGGELPKSALFVHVPLVEFRTSWKTSPHVGGFSEYSVEKGVYAPADEDNIGMFDAIQSFGSTDFVTAGHDHNFNWMREYENVYFHYGRVSGVNAWERSIPIGASVIDIDTNAETLQNRYRVSVIEPSFVYNAYEGW